MSELIRSADPFDLFSRLGRSEWLPPVDIKEEENAYTFELDVPGLSADDLEVELHDGVLTVRGAREEEATEEHRGYIRTERHHGKFVRQFRVPTAAKPDELQASVKDGVLALYVPKTSAAEARRIPIN
jgi:HSP20 family protein